MRVIGQVTLMIRLGARPSRKSSALLLPSTLARKQK